MAGWQLDARRFADEVFVPARDGWNVRNNLFRFFQLPVDVHDDELVEQAVRGVESYLKRSSLAGVHATVASSLRQNFSTCATTMRETARRDQHRAQVLAERRAFADQVRKAMGDMPALRVDELDDYVARWKSRFVRREVEEALAKAHIAVRDPVELVVPAPLPRWADVRLPLLALGHSDLAEYLAVRKLGPGATTADVRQVRMALDRTASGDARTEEEIVLTALEQMVSAGTLADALRRELIDELTNVAEQGKAALDAALARRDVGRRVRDLGFPEGDELAYALLCRIHPVGGADKRLRVEVQQALACRDVRTALALLVGQGSLPLDLADLRLRLQADLTEVDAGLAAAATLEATDPEAAAARYLAVLRIACEPDAESGLHRCRPPAPPSATARVEGERVVVAWAAAAVRAGDPQYRVVRRVDAGPHAGRTELATTSDTTALDPDAPAGTAVAYEICTVRGDVTSVDVVSAGPVVVLRAVSGLAAESGDDEVRLRWQLPYAAVGVRLRRTGDGPPVELAAATTTAHDPTARSGRHYTYAVEAAYDRDGERSFAQAVTVVAHPQRPPDAVTDLALTEEPGGVAVVTWTPPDNGIVQLRLVHRPPPAASTILLTAEAELGEPLRVLRREPAGVHVALPADGRRRWVVPVTVAGELGVVGAAVEQDRRLPPVADMHAVRQGHMVRLSWRWPGRTGEARVLVREGGPVQGPRDAGANLVRITRAMFEQSGCRLPDHPEADAWFAVSLTAYDDGQEVHGPLVQVMLAARPRARYAIRPAGRGRRQIVVTGSALPPVELRYRVAYPPLRRDEGFAIVTVRPTTVDATAMAAEFALPKGRPLHLRAFAADPDHELELVPEDPEQLRVDRGRWW
jgi:hypothetical protein